VTAPTEVLARFTTVRRGGSPVACEEFATPVVPGDACPTCRQLAAGAGRVGALAVAYTTAAGDRRVAVAVRTAGGWAPIRDLAADGSVVRALRRQGRPPAPAHRQALPGLWEVTA
jgi:hypothetical protein